MADDTPYLLRGIAPITTTSSTLVSSSPYLNHPALRDWIASAFLRRSGKDRPTSADGHDLHVILNMTEQAADVALPSIPGRRWHLALDTSRPPPDE